MDLDKVTFKQVFRITLFVMVSLLLIWVLAMVVILGIAALFGGIGGY